MREDRQPTTTETRAASVERNKAVVRKFADAINARDWDRLDRVVAPEFVRHSHAAPEVRSCEELKRYLRQEFDIFPDGQETIEDMLAEHDKVAVRHGFRGTQHGPMGPYPPSGRTMVTEYLAIYRLAGGVIVEAWTEWDNLAGLVQLGHYTPPASPLSPEPPAPRKTRCPRASAPSEINAARTARRPPPSPEHSGSGRREAPR